MSPLFHVSHRLAHGQIEPHYLFIGENQQKLLYFSRNQIRFFPCVPPLAEAAYVE